MNYPDMDCSIEAHCSINPSEDPKKIKQAVWNILGTTDVTIDKNSIVATSKNVQTLEKIYDVIHSHKTQKIYRRNLTNNLHKDSTWFYLNKQAAFVNTIAICEDPEESSLGPIKIILKSKRLDKLIDWLILDTK